MRERVCVCGGGGGGGSSQAASIYLIRHISFAASRSVLELPSLPPYNYKEEETHALGSCPIVARYGGDSDRAIFQSVT